MLTAVTRSEFAQSLKTCIIMNVINYLQLVVLSRGDDVTIDFYLFERKGLWKDIYNRIGRRMVDVSGGNRHRKAMG